MQQRISSPEIQEFETAHIARVRDLASECMVLLKNDGTLPLSGTGKLALYGGGARRTIKGGTGSGDVNVRHFVNVEEGLENAGFEITTKKWLDAYDQAVEEAKTKFFAEIRKQADSAGVNPVLFAMGRTAPEPEYDFALDGEGDTAVYVLARISGEGSDRQTGEGDICLTKTEIRDILALQKKYKKFVLVLNTGGMVDLEPVKDVPAILLMGQLGTPTGDVLADVLTGKSYPSGKLTMTWAPLSAYPSTEGFGDPNDTEYKEGIFVGYRHFDTAKTEVTYPFGYGIGYTEFHIGGSTLFSYDEGMVTIETEVLNIGVRKGREIVQVYVSAPEGKLDKPFHVLAAYVKTKELGGSEKQKVEVTFPLASLASYDEEDACWKLEAGTYQFYVGSNSRDTKKVGEYTLKETIITEKAWREAAQEEPVAVQTLPTGSVTWNDVKNGEKTIEEFADSLTDEQLAYLCIGAYKDSEDLMEVIGNASTTVAGAAGETTGYLKELGLPGIIMADGPAGLRLSQSYVIKDGAAKGGSSLGGDMMRVYTPEELAAMAPGQDEEEGPVYYQYCVAIPIGTAIAQSWNDELAETFGDLVGTEMEQFGIHAWLAPALNIHRSPLCGRNFEYYSEDPLISGRMAAAITKGVQKHPGRATTIKHFACNNQETNRYFSNSIISERAMREIYLKGFEICVKEAQPHFIMTSYNLINGEHACNRRDLLTDILRNEWGFEGMVMTDWLVTGGMGPSGEKWPCASAAGNVKAGNDVTMPGIPSDKRDIMDALKNPEHPYAIRRNDLLVCAKRVLKEILALVA